MMTWTRRLMGHCRATIASLIVLSTMVVSLGVAVPSSSALGTSPFCQLMFSYRPVKAPTAITQANYRAWAKLTLPFFEKLAADAPNSKTKDELNSLVAILQFEENATSKQALQAYVLANSAKWATGGKALASAILSCMG